MSEHDDNMRAPSSRLLGHGDPPPVAGENLGAMSPLMLIGDHAGRIIPGGLDNLGLRPGDLALHIASDIGVAGLGQALAHDLEAPFLHQRYSRLVIDCNRAPGAEGSIAAASDGTSVPGNQALAPDARFARRREIFQPYHDRIAAELDARAAQDRRTILVSLHSFTPVFGGEARPWRFGVLHRHDSAFSGAVLARLQALWGEAVGDNRPYAMDDVDYTVPFHAGRRGLDYLELEVRQDLLATPADQKRIAAMLFGVLRAALAVVA